MRSASHVLPFVMTTKRGGELFAAPSRPPIFIFPQNDLWGIHAVTHFNIQADQAPADHIYILDCTEHPFHLTIR